MVHQLVYSLVAVFIVSLISFVGIFTASLNQRILNKFLIFIVAFSAGSLLATAFFDLIPESLNSLGNFYFVVGGIVLFFIIEASVHWHHYHEEDCVDCIKPVVYLNLIGDGIHNFLDGIIIVASFLISIPTGIATAFAIALHEIPQEIGDFAVLVNSGLKAKKAIFLNFMSALFAVIGGIVSYFFLSYFENAIPYVIALAAGGFIYISATDLFPELHKTTDKKKILVQILSVVLGIVLMIVLFSILPE